MTPSSMFLVHWLEPQACHGVAAGQNSSWDLFLVTPCAAKSFCCGKHHAAEHPRVLVLDARSKWGHLITCTNIRHVTLYWSCAGLHLHFISEDGPVNLDKTNSKRMNILSAFPMADRIKFLLVLYGLFLSACVVMGNTGQAPAGFHN